MKLHSVFLLLLLFFGLVHPSLSGELIPFNLPWNDDSGGVTNVSGLLDAPAGKDGFIRVDGDRYVDGTGKPFRILGVNTAFSGNFPSHSQSTAIAQRMAKFGINCVRIHHLDTQRAPSGIWRNNVAAKQELDPVRLDRLDYFINELKKNGIYVNLNLKVGRETVAADDVPGTSQLPTYDKGPDHFFPRLVELQKDFARDILTHENPYTGLRYVDDPVFAVVEINNESGLVAQWSNQSLDDLPQVYHDVLQERWNQFLNAKYSSTAALREAWTPQTGGSGEELLTRGETGWTLQQVEAGRGTRQFVNEGPSGERALKIETTATSDQGWHVQSYYTGLSVKKGANYEVKLWMKAEPRRTVSVGISQDHSPWGWLDSFIEVDVGTAWREYTFSFSPSSDDNPARLNVTNLAAQLGAFWLSGSSMIDKPLVTVPDEESLEAGTISIVLRRDYSAKSLQARRDWIDFLLNVETEYNREMYEYLRNDLGVQSLITGTQLGFSGYQSQMGHDFIDIHGYWHHPNFPNQPWDAVDWTVTNESIVNGQDNVLQGIMTRQVEGKPYALSEYNHPAPNTYSSETIPLTAAYGAFQDWDGIYFFAYSHSDQYQTKSINSFFDIAGHTPKMLSMPAAANMFLRGDVSPADTTIVTVMSEGDQAGYLADNGGNLWNFPSLGEAFPSETPYLHRTTVRFGADPQPIQNPAVSVTPRQYESDTGELYWNRRLSDFSYVTIRSQLTKGFVGFVRDREFDLGHGVSLKIGETIQDWANVLFTKMQEDEHSQHWLLTATGYCENTGMRWKDDSKTSVGNNWGSGPPLVETVPLQLTFTGSESRPRVITLDERGQAREVISDVTSIDGDTVVIDLMERQPSLWYEIVFERTGINDPVQHQ